MDLREVFSSAVLVAFIIGLFSDVTDAAGHLSCYQCNIFVRGSPWPCDSERGMKVVDGCHACLKTFTRTYLHNTFFDQTFTSFESRVCVKDRDYMKSDGCHPHESASGYMKRCFCYDHLCNTGSNNRHGNGIMMFMSIMFTVFTFIL